MWIITWHVRVSSQCSFRLSRFGDSKWKCLKKHRASFMGNFFDSPMDFFLSADCENSRCSVWQTEKLPWLLTSNEDTFSTYQHFWFIFEAKTRPSKTQIDIDIRKMHVNSIKFSNCSAISVTIHWFLSCFATLRWQVRFLLFPCNQFGAQEPKTNAEIKTFAEQYVSWLKLV